MGHLRMHVLRRMTLCGKGEGGRRCRRTIVHSVVASAALKC
jgi:hypothetical protein